MMYKKVIVNKVFFTPPVLQEFFVAATMDVTTDIGIRNLRFRAVCSKNGNDRMERR